jgi:glycolate oxidase FAD binding subunit
MLTDVQREELARAFGEAGVEEHAPVEVDGAPLALTLRPADGAALARGLEALAGAGLSVVVRGGGTRLDLGNPPRAPHALLSTERLVGLDEFDPSEGVCHARAGTPLADVRAAVGSEGWELPLDPPGAGSTLGGTLAAASLGPRSLGFGLPRAAVLGLEVVLPSGERTRCGGRVVKNVTGFDLNKLYTGSLGTLGVIEGAWLRLCPQPGRVALLEATLSRDAEPCAAGLVAARRASARATALLDGPGTEALRLVVEFAGDERAVERDVAWLEETLGAREGAPGALDDLRAGQQSAARGGGLRFRISSLATRLDAALVPLRREGADLLVHPGLGLLYGGFSVAPDDVAAVARAFDAARAAARESGGDFVLESAPTWAKRGHDVFDGSADALRLVRALKSRFDPAGTLNPGRFLGHT